MAEDCVTGGVSDDDGTLGGDLKGLVVAAVLLGHESNIGNVASGSPVELSVLLAVLDDGVVHGGVGAVGDDALNLLQLVILVPHLTTITNHVGHGSVNDDITAHVQVGDALVRVDHGKSRPCGVGGVNVGNDLRFHGVALDLLVQVAKAVVHIDA